MEINKLTSGDIYTGSLTFYIHVGKEYVIEADQSFVVNYLTEDGEITKTLSSYNNKVHNKSGGIMQVVPAQATAFWTPTYQDEAVSKEVPDPTPIEVGLEKPPTLIERMQQFIRSELANNYGAGSQELETWEEAQDFMMNDADDIVSPYELHAMQEEMIEPPTEPAPEPTPETTETEPVPEPSPEPPRS